jgi:hypothetical protein
MAGADASLLETRPRRLLGPQPRPCYGPDQRSHQRAESPELDELRVAIQTVETLDSIAGVTVQTSREVEDARKLGPDRLANSSKAAPFPKPSMRRQTIVGSLVRKLVN